MIFTMIFTTIRTYAWSCEDGKIRQKSRFTLVKARKKITLRSWKHHENEKKAIFCAPPTKKKGGQGNNTQHSDIQALIQRKRLHYKTPGCARVRNFPGSQKHFPEISIISSYAIWCTKNMFTGKVLESTKRCAPLRTPYLYENIFETWKVIEKRPGSHQDGIRIPWTSLPDSIELAFNFTVYKKFHPNVYL